MGRRLIYLIPGIGDVLADQLMSGFHPKIKRKITYAEDLKDDELNYLPDEARLTIKYLDGNSYSKEEMEEVKKKFVIPFSKNCKKWEIAGSYRRGKFPCNDMDLLVILKINPVFVNSNKLKIVRNGDRKTKILFKFSSRFIPIDIFYTEPKWWVYSLIYFTGSKNFNIYIRGTAKKKGLRLNEYGLFDKNGEQIKKLNTEKSVMMYILNKYYPPHERSK